jgi:pyruvate dehydrogenase E1 component beta subunit
MRSIKPLDRDTIINSVIKTGRLVTVEDGYPQHGIGAELVAIVHETRAFDYLKGPVERVTSVDIPMPYASNL